MFKHPWIRISYSSSSSNPKRKWKDPYIGICSSSPLWKDPNVDILKYTSSPSMENWKDAYIYTWIPSSPFFASSYSPPSSYSPSVPSIKKRHEIKWLLCREIKWLLCRDLLLLFLLLLLLLCTYKGMKGTERIPMIKILFCLIFSPYREMEEIEQEWRDPYARISSASFPFLEDMRGDEIIPKNRSPCKEM